MMRTMMYYKFKEFPECNIMQITAEQAKKERENTIKEIERMSEEPIYFEEVLHAGFRFGNHGKMYFVPCYSEQNGY